MSIYSKKNKSIFLVHLVFIFLCLSTVIPFLLVVSVSLSKESDILKYGYSLIPRNFDLTAYRFIFANPVQLLNAYKISIIVTLLGTVVSLFMMSMVAYALSRKSFRYRKIITFYIFFTMLFSGGLVPFYILMVRYLNLNNTIWALILPGLTNAFHIIMLRTFFQKLPDSIFDSARIDGASEYRIFFRIVIPLSKPVLATISLFGVLMRWNDWFNAMLFLNNEKLYPLQYLLQRMIMDLQFLQSQMNKLPASVVQSIDYIPTETVRMAMVIVAAGPMLFIFPFFQRYFVRGLTIGSVKG